MAASLTDEQIERLHLEYALSRKIDRAAKAAGVSWASARKYLSQPIDLSTPLSQVREQKKIDIAEKLGELQIVLIEALKRSDKIEKASFQELANTLGIATEKRQLITGQATERYEHRDLDEPRQSLAGRVDELARRRGSTNADQRTRAVGS